MLRTCFQSFSLRYSLKNTLEKTFSTCVRLHFSASFILFCSPFLFLRVHERQIISLSYMDISKTFCGGVLQKFLPLIIIGKLRAVCWGISRKFYKNFSAIIGFFADRNISVFSKNLKHPPHILDICIPVCWGVSLIFFKKSPTIIGNLRLET